MIKLSSVLGCLLVATAAFSGAVQTSERFEITPPPGWQLEDTLLNKGIRTDLYKSGDLDIWTVFDRTIKEKMPAERLKSLSEQAALVLQTCREPALETLNENTLEGEEALVFYSCQPQNKKQTPFVAFSKRVKGEQGWYRFGLEKEFDDLTS